MTSVFPNIIADRRDGMGARLNAICNAARIANSYELTWKFAWQDSIISSQAAHIAEHDPTELFSQEFLDRFLIPDHSYSMAPAKAIRLPEDTKSKKEFLQNIQSGKTFMSAQNIHITRFPWETLWSVRSGFRAAFKSMGWSNAIQSKINEIDAFFSSSKVIAFHLRRGDIIDPDCIHGQVNWADKYLPTSMAEVFANSYANNSHSPRFLILSETEKELEIFKRKFPDSLGVGDVVAFGDLTAVQKDFLEIYIMSQAKEIVSAGDSAFSSMAKNIGQSKSRTLPRAYGRRLTKRAYTALVQDLQKNKDRFQNNPDFAQALIKTAGYLTTPNRLEQLYAPAKSLSASMDCPGYIFDLVAEFEFLKGNYEASQMAVAKKRKSDWFVSFSGHGDAMGGFSQLALGHIKKAAFLLHRAEATSSYASKEIDTLLATFSALNIGTAEEKFYHNRNWIRYRKSKEGIDKKILRLLPELEARYSQKCKKRGLPIIAHQANFLLWPEKIRGWRMAMLMGSVNYERQIKQVNRDRLANDDRVFLCAAVSLLHGRAEEALDALQPIPKSLRKDATALSFKGLIFARLGRPKKALEFFARSINADGAGALAQIRFAQTLAQLGHWQRAEPIFAKLESSKENWVEALYAAAGFWALSGNEKRTRMCIQKLETDMGITRRLVHAKIKVATRFGHMEEALELGKILNYLVSENDMRGKKFFTL